MRRLPPSQYAQTLRTLAQERPSAVREIARDFVSLLARQHRLRLVPRIIAALERQAAARGESARVELTTAKIISDPNKLALALAQQLGLRHVNLETRVDPTLVGGARLRVGDRLVDGSIHGMLTQLTRRV